MKNHRAHESGVLNFDGLVIHYESRLYGSFTVPLSEVAVIGEFTTDHGPFVDDWFLVFVPRSSEWFEASMYSEGCEQARDRLSCALGVTLASGLAASTDFASRVIWPIELADRPLFTFNRESGSGFLRRLKLSILPEIGLRLSSDVLSAVE